MSDRRDNDVSNLPLQNDVSELTLQNDLPPGIPITTPTEYAINLRDESGILINTVTIPRAIFNSHFHRPPSDMLSSTYVELLLYLNGESKPSYEPHLAALEPKDRLRGSFCFRHSMTRTVTEAIELGQMVSSAIREDVLDLMAKAGLVFSSADSVLILTGEYYCTQHLNFFEVNWDKVIHMLKCVSREDSTFAATFYFAGWNWKTAVAYSSRMCQTGGRNAYVFDYDSDASFSLIRQMRSRILRTLLLIKPVSSALEVAWVRDSIDLLGLSYFLGGDVDQVPPSGHVFDLHELVTKTWYGSNNNDVSTRGRSLAIIRNVDRESLPLLQHILTVAISHDETRHRRLLHLLTHFHTSVKI